ncbi:MAG: hypothetical protein KGJ98_07165 [Chloroflexota bacterium]|nr:hypothetical protein [Chloroflexota bacterium]
MALAVGVLVLVVAVALQPSTTEVYVDFQPRPVTQPLYAKLLAFIDRDVQMRELSDRIVGDATEPEEKALRILHWTAANIRPTPPGMPIVDDHPYFIVVRGYGQADQATDVFANLAAYQGMTGGLVYSKRSDGRNYYALAVIRIDGADRVFDVREDRALRAPDGRLATLDELRADPSMLEGLPAPAAANGATYPVLIRTLESGTIRRPSNQMPLSRIIDEIGRLLHR